jgi:hypothetical protein
LTPWWSIPKFLVEAEKAKLLVTPMAGDVVTRHLAELYTTPPDLVPKAKAITGDKP